MKKIILALLISFAAFYDAHAQVGIGTTVPAPDAILELKSSDKALLLTRVPDVESVVNPVNGMIVYDISLDCVRSYQKGVWSPCNGTLVPAILTLDCTNVVLSGSLTAGITATGVTASVPYTGGNAGTYSGQSVSSTGVDGLTATLFGGTLAEGAGSLLYKITGTPTNSGTASFTITLAGFTCSFTMPVSLQTPIVTELLCSNIVTTGTLTANVDASGVTATINYTGGNGSVYNPQVISSTGVLGLTAFLNSGTLANGTGGSLVFSISGKPASLGTATFLLNLGGQSCSFSLEVAAEPAIVEFISCSAGSAGTLTQGQAANNVTQTTSYSGGNGASYSALSVPSSGVTGLTASLAAGALATGNGNLVFTITGTPSSTGVATFNISLFGSLCSFTRNVLNASATAQLTCNSRTFNPATLTRNVAYTGTLTIPYTSGNSLSYSAGSPISSTGVTGLSARLRAGTLGTTGNLIYDITGTPTSNGTATFNITFGTSNCSITITVNGATITGLTCASATFNPGTITINTAYSGTLTVPYTGGNGAPYNAGAPISSTGATGLTATLQAGTLAVGSGNLTYTVTGTATTSGTANFALSFGNQSCTVSKAINSFPTSYTPTTTIVSGQHFTTSNLPYLFDNRTTYVDQDVTFGNMQDLRLHQDNKDIVQLVLNPAVIPGGKLVIYWSRIEKPNGLGLIVDLKNGAVASQSPINTLTNIMPNATQTASGNDMTLTITLTATTNTIIIKSSQDNDGKDPILTEIRAFNSNNVQIPIN